MSLEKTGTNSRYFAAEENTKKRRKKSVSDNEVTNVYDIVNVCDRTVKPMKRLPFDFFNVACIDLAKRLLGQVIIRQLNDGTRLSGAIIETECYPGAEDKASHSYNGKRTERNTAMFMKPGTAYVYIIYGMYNCFNISCQGDGAAVLIRSIRPLEGLEAMQVFRSARRKSEKTLKEVQLCNGPSKLCQALNIEKQWADRQDLVTSNELWLEGNSTVDESEIIACPRIGIESYGKEYSEKPLRFYVRNCPYVSIKDKKAEANYSVLSNNKGTTNINPKIVAHEDEKDRS